MIIDFFLQNKYVIKTNKSCAPSLTEILVIENAPMPNTHKGISKWKLLFNGTQLLFAVRSSQSREILERWRRFGIIRNFSNMIKTG